MTMRRPRAISLGTGLALAAAAVAAGGCAGGEQLVPADQARSLDSALQQVADATRAGECRRALNELAAAQRIYADLPDTLDERLAARIKQGLDQLARTVPTQCADVPQTPTRPSTTTDGADDHDDRADDHHDHDHHDTDDDHHHADDDDHADHPDGDRDDAERRHRARGDGHGDGAVSDRLLAGRYELGERLGSGGMSTVVLAFDRRLERNVAVKLLAEHLADDQQFVSRFRREALAAARLVHPNIVQVFDFGLDEASGRQYIVMEHVEGQSCAEILRERGTLPVAEALGIVAQACRGLDYAHRGGVVHRDVKPGNLLRSTDGIVKLADFGIAKALSEESSITQVGAVLGTAAYLAPEQAAGVEATPRSDIYALGVVTYQLLSGRLPYEAQTLTELALKQQREAPALLDHLTPEVTPELAAAVDRALALEPADRYATAEELREALVAGARGVAPETSATRVVPAAAAETGVTRAVTPPPGPATPVQQRQPLPPSRPPLTPAHPPPPQPMPARRARRRRLAPTLVLLTALLVGGAIIVGVLNGQSDTVRLRQVVYDQVDQTVSELQQLVRQNTR